MIGLERVEEERRRDPSDRGQRAAIRATVSQPIVELKREAWERINGEGYGSDYLTRAAIAGFQWSHQRDLLADYRSPFYDQVGQVYRTRDHAYAESYLRWLVPDLWAEPEEAERIRAAILEHGWNEKRRELAARYHSNLEGTDYWMAATRNGSEPVYHLFPIGCKDKEAVGKALSEAGIGWGQHYPIPVHLLPAFSYLGYSEGDFPVSEKAA